jgi:hypothetical protein
MIHPTLLVPPVAPTPHDSEIEPSSPPLPPEDVDDGAPFAPIPNHLQPLSRKLTQAAIDLLAYAERNEIHLFETVVGGQRLAIEIAILPRVGRDSSGAMRVRPELPPLAT